MTFYQEVKNPRKIYIITSKQIFTIYSDNPFNSEENGSFSFTMDKNVLISKIGSDVFKITFTDIKIIPCAQIIREINYINVKFSQVTIKTDVMVFEIRKYQ